MKGSKDSGHLLPTLKNQVQQRMENGAVPRLLSGSYGLGFPKIRGYLCEIPRKMASLGVYIGSPVHGSAKP